MRTSPPKGNSIPLVAFLAAASLLGGSLAAPAADCAAVPGSIAAWWAAEGNASETVNGNDGVLRNGTGFGSGMVGLAFLLNGIDQYVEVPDAPALNPTQEIALEAWVFPTATPGLGRTIISKDDESYDRQYLLNMVTSPQSQPVFRFHVRTPSGYAILNGTNAVPLNAWTHVVATYDGLAMRLYVNGVLETSMPRSGSIVTYPQPLRIGRGGSEYFFSGMIDEVAVYSRALPDADVLALYSAGAAGKCSTPLPVFLVHPTNQTVIAEETVGFYGMAMGSRPLSYQWFFEGNPITGATTDSLWLTNVQAANSGNYSLQAENVFGTTVSSNAVLVVNPPPPCLEPGAGLIAHWRGELAARDSVGGNDAAWGGAPAYSNGVVRQAFVFKGNNHLTVSNAPSLNPASQFSFETWIYPETVPAFALAILAKDNNTSERQYLMNLIVDGPKMVCRAHLGVGSQFLVLTGTNQVPVGAWTHVAMTYDGAFLRLFVNGLLDSSIAATGKIGGSAQPVLIGRQPSGYNFVGRIDEPSIYGRALSAQEIQGIYSYGTGGKCASPVPPFIVAEPNNLTATLGSNATLVAAGAGSVPLGYQWNFQGVPLPGATNQSFTISNASFSHAGDYAVTVSNLAGMVTSRTAVVTLVYPPAIISLSGADVPSGGSATVPVSIVANGNENSLAFSLSYDTSRLKFSGASLGADASAGVLMANHTQTNIGRIGLAMALPPNAALNAGTQQVVLVHFNASIVTSPTATSVAFSDQPTARVLLDKSLATLAANYAAAASVSIAAAEFEADVFPRPAGDRVINLSDWLLLGRYAARLAYPTNSAEFQRADCAGRSTSGDAAIKVTDWVQAGRCAFGFDTWLVRGGPVAESPLVPPIPSSNRLATVAGVWLNNGESAIVHVNLVALGDENALGFSLDFDPSKAAFVDVAPGAHLTGAALNVNATQAGTGRLGFALALATGQSFAPGTNNLLKVAFKALPGVVGAFQPAFGDVPVPRQTSDLAAAELPTGFLVEPGTPVTPPSLRIWISDQYVNLAWPLWASNYSLQEAVGDVSPTAQWTNSASVPVPVEGENLVTVPPTAAPRFYRLKSP